MATCNKFPLFVEELIDKHRKEYERLYKNSLCGQWEKAEIALDEFIKVVAEFKNAMPKRLKANHE